MRRAILLLLLLAAGARSLEYACRHTEVVGGVSYTWDFQALESGVSDYYVDDDEYNYYTNFCHDTVTDSVDSKCEGAGVCQQSRTKVCCLAKQLRFGLGFLCC
jgi:hypothetical protein